MAYVKNILEKKGSQVYTIAPDATIREALLFMKEKGTGALLVVEGDPAEGGKIAGIFSERDYARRVAATECSCLDELVSAFMTHPVFYISPEQTLDECMMLMTAKHIRHLPVLENERLAGIISIGDVIKSIIVEKEMTIKGLEHYITGSQVR